MAQGKAAITVWTTTTQAQGKAAEGNLGGGGFLLSGLSIDAGMSLVSLVSLSLGLGLSFCDRHCIA